MYGPSATERLLGTIREEKGISLFVVLGFPSRLDMTLTVESDVKTHSFLLPIHTNVTACHIMRNIGTTTNNASCFLLLY